MSKDSLQARATLTKGLDTVQKRDEQIRRVLNAAQYQKYKEIEKSLQTPFQPTTLVAVPPAGSERDN
ncbi:MAG: hypothetical protein FGM61_12650 [Sediminibacterium sp.]|nr:hypothetical protein [Sediminibacterium sp.]